MTDTLLDMAKVAMGNAYSPFSKFKVGAALRTKGGKIFTGCNVENASFGLTCCAERTAVFKAISEGFDDFEEITITTSNPETPVAPCGACRQVLNEFNKELIVNLEDKKTYKLSELLPDSFSGKDF